MSIDDLNDGSDLFDFPEARGVDSFGFNDPAEESFEEASLTEGEGALGAREAALEVDPVPNPPLPEGLSDLDHDLFDFDSAMNATGYEAADPTPQPVPAFEEEALESSIDQAEPASDSVFQTAPDAGVAPAAIQEPNTEPEAVPAPASAAPAPSLLRDPGPRIVLPEDMPNASSWDRNRSLVALVGCFLLVNTGIFFLAQQASDRFNQTIADATGLMAQVLLDQQANEAQAAAPANADPSVQHLVEASEPEVADTDVSDDPLIDPREYDNTHQLAVGRAKALLERGKPEEARMLLNFVLANRDRVPLSNSLREEIDYLIPFTYFEQGNAVAPEEAR